MNSLAGIDYMGGGVKNNSSVLLFIDASPLKLFIQVIVGIALDLSVTEQKGWVKGHARSVGDCTIPHTLFAGFFSFGHGIMYFTP